jgi:hypothetical protein
MNRRPASPPPSPHPRTPSRGTAFSQAQKLILLLTGLLLFTLVAVILIFILSPGNALDQPKPGANPTQQSRPSALAPTSAGTEPPAASIPISAGCLQQNGGVEEGQVSSVDEQGMLEVITPGGVVHAIFAGIDLLPREQPGEQAVQAIRSLVLNQTVVLVRDRANHAATNPAPRYIFTSEKFINDELVRQGLAEVQPTTSDPSCALLFQISEQKARSAKLGFWQPGRVPTRTFIPFVTLDNSQQGACDCSKRYECSDFSTHADAQTCYNACNDYNSRLDPDRNGLACEELP